MLKVVIDTTVLVSAFLRFRPGGASHDLLQLSASGAFELYLSDDILEEAGRVLSDNDRNRRRYGYPDEQVVEFCQGLAELATIVQDVPSIAIVRDPNDDMVLACAIKAEADYLVSRDNDLLSIGEYQEINIITPEAFLRILRSDMQFAS